MFSVQSPVGELVGADDRRQYSYNFTKYVKCVYGVALP
jgi:hypothetical protein